MRDWKRNRMKRIQVALLLLLACSWSSDVPTTVKTVQRGETVSEPVINASALAKDDQLLTYHRGELCAQYFCDNGICHNTLSSAQFQVLSGDLCLIIPNVNTSSSGQYKVTLNGLKDVLNLILIVEEDPQRSSTFTEDPQRSSSTAVIAVPIALLVGLFLVICSI